jgi:hypothetical protein
MISVYIYVEMFVFQIQKLKTVYLEYELDIIIINMGNRVLKLVHKLTYQVIAFISYVI